MSQNKIAVKINTTIRKKALELNKNVAQDSSAIKVASALLKFD